MRKKSLDSENERLPAVLPHFSLSGKTDEDDARCSSWVSDEGEEFAVRWV